MKHETTTLNTKKAFAASLKKLMAKKPLSKITISELAADSGVNRKTFYYHFEDMYALLKWMLEREAIEVVKNFDLLMDQEEAVLFVINYVEDNAHILNCAYDSIGRDEMKRFFYSDFIGIMRTLVDGKEKELGVSVPAGFKGFLCEMYAEAIAGALIEWFRDKSRYGREEVLQYISLIMRASLPSVLSMAAELPDGAKDTVDAPREASQ